MVDSTEAPQPNTAIEPVNAGPGRTRVQVPEEVLAEVIDRRNLNVPLREIAKWLADEHDIRVGNATINRWTTDAAAKLVYVDPATLGKLRTREGQRLDALMKLAMRQAYEHAGTKFGLAAMAQAVQISRTYATLYGLNMPVRHDISMTVETEQDRALKAMLEQARLKAEQDRQRVIEAASADPTL